MRAALAIAYVVMAVWLVLSSVLRIVLQLGGGSPLDPFPFIGVGLGLVALVALGARRSARSRRL